MDESYAERDLNVGFSGGEKKKAEIFCTPDTGKYMETWKIH